jgi:hypothetical protein
VGLLNDSERGVVEAVAALADGNPFLPERVDLERRALGTDFAAGGPVWHADADLPTTGPNEPKVRALVERLSGDLRGRLVASGDASAAEIALYQGVIRYLLFQRYDDEWYALLEAEASGARTKRVAAFGRFAHDVDHFLSIPGRTLPVEGDAAHLFALGFQARRAFHYIFRQIFGSSMPAAALRAAVWQSIFTHRPARYRRVLYRRLGDVPTLIIGESGSGKELVARAIALSRYIPFDTDAQAFVADSTEATLAVNLSALTPALIESELFGHRRGAFTGATEDRQGWLEVCGTYGCVFLDEIGELDPAIQVKLLRVLQTRVFQRIGETEPRRFAGKVIAATNRDLDEEIAAGRFRSDLYYRICADLIRTPSLREQLRDAPGDLRTLILILARRAVDDDAEETTRLATETEAWIEQHLGAEYGWPGNVRELEQCVRNILIRGEYEPRRAVRDDAGALADAMRRGTLTVDQLVQRYCAVVYGQTHSYRETARRLGIDRRTVMARLGPPAAGEVIKDPESTD